MTEAAAEASRTPPGRRSARSALTVIAAVVLIVAVVLAALYLNRRAAAREILVGWLDSRGIDARVEVEQITLSGFVGRIHIGDPNDPDFAVERAEVDYAIAAPWSAGGLGVSPTRIRLIRPVLKARWADGKFSLGSLDPLVEEFLGRPPRPDSRAPLVLVETGRLRLTTEYGALQVLADARIADNKLMRLSARMPSAALRSGDVAARVEHATLEVVTTGDRAAVRLDAALNSLATGAVSAEAAVVSLRGDLPYPDLKARRDDGVLTLDGTLTADRLTTAGFDARTARAAVAFDGSTSGWIDAFRLIGDGDAVLTAARLSGPGLAGTATTLRAQGGQFTLARNPRGVEWRMDSPAVLRAATLTTGGAAFRGLDLQAVQLTAGGRNAAFELAGPVAVSADGFTFGDLALRGISGQLAMDATSDGGGLVTARGGLAAGGGSWPLFGVAGADDPEELAAMKAALGDFRLAVPGLHLTAGGAGVEATLTRPAQLAPANGGVLTVSPASTPIYRAAPGRAGGGAFALAATRGAGLPQMDFAVPSWRLTGDGFSADLDGRAALDFALGRGIDLTTRGTLASGGGRLTYTARDCAAVTVERLELGENDAVGIAGDFCPAGRPLVTVRDGAWRAVGALRGVSASVPFLGGRFTGADGSLTVDGGPRGIGLDVVIARAGVEDTETPRRFHPLTASGRASLNDERWSGAFDLAVQDRPLGQVTLAHDGRLESGGVVIAAPNLVFTADGLQPEDVTPLTEGFLNSPVEGVASFDGRFDWTPAGLTSSGVASTPGLDFASPAGPVKGLKGSVAFASLTPLVTAPGQTLTADSIAAFAPLSDVGLTFELTGEAVRVSGGRLTAGGGTVSVEPFDLPFDRTAPVTGVIVLDRVQLGDLIGATGFAEKVAMDAVVSGRLPFTSDAEHGVRIAGGSLSAVEPGRLSIQREALTGLEAGGGGEVPPGTVQDLAYQAMENLSFDILSAEVNSLDEGRLGVLFRIKGRHDPPVEQQLRLTLAELISRDFLNRPLPLPSGTGIDLTLDTTLNINQLLSDLLALDRARRGEAEPEQ